MRIFTHGDGPSRKSIQIAVQGRRITVLQSQGDGSLKKSEKELPSEADAATAYEHLIRDLLGRGYVEKAVRAKPASNGGQPSSAKTEPATAARSQAASGTRPPSSVSAKSQAPTAAKPKAPPEPKPADIYDLDEVDEGTKETPAPAMPRLATAPALADASGRDGTATADKPRKKKGKKKKGKVDGEKKDWLFLGGITAVAILVLGGGGYLVYDMFLRPPTLIGTWQGSKLENEISKSLTHESYRITFNPKGRTLMVYQHESQMAGDYSLKGNTLKVTFDGDGEETPDPVEYKIKLTHPQLELIDASGKPVVKLLRMSEMDSVPDKLRPGGAKEAGGKGKEDGGSFLPELNASLATEEHVAKDTSFACKFPKGWSSQGGSRPDNTYGWAEFGNGSARIRIDADVTGSLMAGNPVTAPQGENVEPPVAVAHELGKRNAGENYAKYQEGKAQPFQSTGLGEGRIAEFVATTSGLFGSSVHGYRATLLTNNRRITVVCETTESDWAQIKPTFFAVIISVRQ